MIVVKLAAAFLAMGLGFVGFRGLMNEPVYKRTKIGVLWGIVCIVVALILIAFAFDPQIR